MAPSSTVVSKLKVQLKLAIARLRMMQSKEIALAKKNRRDMAMLLESDRVESAKIRVENIIAQDIATELLEILELYCELLLARVQLLDQPVCDPGLEEAVKSIIHAAPRTDIRELHTCRALLIEKFGKEVAQQAVSNSDNKVATRVTERLKIEPPKPELVQSYLEEIARAYDIDWPKGRRDKPSAQIDDEDEDDNPPGGLATLDKGSIEDPLTTKELSKATPPRDLSGRSPVTMAPQSPTTENPRPHIKLPQPPDLKPSGKLRNAMNTKEDDNGSAVSGQRGVDEGKSMKAENGKGTVPGRVPTYDDLAKRFAALKR